MNDSLPTVGRFLLFAEPLARPFHVPISFFGDGVITTFPDASCTSIFGEDIFRTERYAGILRRPVGVDDALSLLTEQLSTLLRRPIGERGILLNCFFVKLSLYKSSENPVFRNPVVFETSDTSTVISSSVINTPACSNDFVSSAVVVSTASSSIASAVNAVSGVSIGLDGMVSIKSAFELSSSVGEHCESLEV